MLKSFYYFAYSKPVSRSFPHTCTHSFLACDQKGPQTADVTVKSNKASCLESNYY